MEIMSKWVDGGPQKDKSVFKYPDPVNVTYLEMGSLQM